MYLKCIFMKTIPSQNTNSTNITKVKETRPLKVLTRSWIDPQIYIVHMSSGSRITERGGGTNPRVQSANLLFGKLLPKTHENKRN